MLARSRNENWRRPDSQRSSVGKRSHRQTTATLQIRLQERPEGHEFWPEHLKSLNLTKTFLVTGIAEGPLQVSRDVCPTVQGDETEDIGTKPDRQTSVRFHPHSVSEGLALPYWPIQPHPKLYRIEHPGQNYIVLLDWRMPTMVSLFAWLVQFANN